MTDFLFGELFLFKYKNLKYLCYKNKLFVMNNFYCFENIIETIKNLFWKRIFA